MLIFDTVAKIENTHAIPSHQNLFLHRDSSEGIATGYALDGRCSIPERGKKYLSFPQRQDLPLERPILQGNGGFFPGRVKRQEREADHSPLSNAEVKNGGAIPPFL
jgi:hypothetical protein